MDSLFKRIRQRLSSWGTSSEDRSLVAAAFGKHPGWDDHMDDIQTPAVAALKRILYDEGIGRNIDNGRWAELESRQSAIEFGHTFVWCRDSDTIAGRLWPSRDGRGRTSYPMVVCVHCLHVPLRWVYDYVLPRLVRLETECRNSGTANEVRACLSACQEALLVMLDKSDRSEQEPCGEADPIIRLMDSAVSGPDKEGLIRILYHIDREMSAGVVSCAGRDGYEHSVHVRVPASGGHVAETSIVWTTLLLREYGQHAGVFVIMPQQETWLDIIIGDPSPQLYCLRVSSEALPLTSTVPYKISDEFVERVRQRAGIARTHNSS
ncbi:MAG: hypothetical protein ABFE13_15545 [Phycisphaerales bacterium]